ncbi:MAG: DUF423 domain-containing protein [Hyphomonadaceae bacterium]|nr:DUF423 domain-containing protein [Hyphomonadaceae bacterium]
MNLFAAYALIGALMGCVSVIVGAFATHGVSDPRAHELMDIGARYQFMHAMASIASLTFWNWGARRARFAPPAFFIGIVAFCGSLYAMALGAPSALGMITPIGGLCFLAGWLVLAWAALTLKTPRERGTAP